MKRASIVAILSMSIGCLFAQTTPQYIQISGITTPAAANGIYAKAGTAGSLGWAYWKHQSADYYVYANQYTDGGYYWNIDADLADADVFFFSDCMNYKDLPYFTANYYSPQLVTNYVPASGTEVSPDVVTIIEYTSPAPEIAVTGNSQNIADGSASPSFSNYTEFGSVNASSGTKARTFTIRNTGTAALSLTGSSPYVSIGGANDSDFSVTVIPSSSVAAGGTATFEITFNPSAAGTRSASISIANNDGDENPYNYSIQGRGYYPQDLMVSGITNPAAANGVYTHQGVFSDFQYWKHQTQNYYIYNDEYSSSRYWNIDVNTDDATQLFFSTNPDANTSPVDVSGWNAKDGAGTPVITYVMPEINIQGNSTSILDGDGTPSSTDQTDFGSVAVTGGTVVRTFTIQNTGGGTLNLTGSSPYVAVGGTNSADFSVTSTPSTPIAASGSATFQVTFNPIGSGTRSATLSIANDDADENPYNFSIQGTGTPAAVFTNGANAGLNFVQPGLVPPEDNWPLGQFSLTGDATGVTLNSVRVTLAGTYDSGDLVSNPLQLYASNTNSFSGASAIGTSQADPGSGNDVTFSSLSDAIPAGTRYYWVTSDVAASATHDDHIHGTVDAAGDVSVSGGTLGTSSFGLLNTGADASLPVGLVSFSCQVSGRSVILSWVTESETENLGFIIERSEGDSPWIIIASHETHEALKGQGTTSSRTEYAFADENVRPGNEYAYRLSDVSVSGAVQRYASLSIAVSVLPGETEMDKAYPNPFNPSTYIAYRLSEDGDVRITVFDAMGRSIRVLHEGRQSAGSYQVYWNGTDNGGRRVSSGMYLIRMQAGEVLKVQKVMLAR